MRRAVDAPTTKRRGRERERERWTLLPQRGGGERDVDALTTEGKEARDCRHRANENPTILPPRGGGASGAQTHICAADARTRWFPQENSFSS